MASPRTSVRGAAVPTTPMLHLPLSTSVIARFAFVVDPTVRQLKLYKRQRQCNCKEDHCQGRGVAHIEITKCRLVEVQHIEPGRVVRTAARRQKRNFENPQGSDEREH